MNVDKVILFEGPDGPVTIRANPKAQRADETEDAFFARVWEQQPHPAEAVPLIVDVSDLGSCPDRATWFAEVQKRAASSAKHLLARD